MIGGEFLNTEADRAVLRLGDGLRFAAGPDIWSLGPIETATGEWIALVPFGNEPSVDLSGPLSFVLATMQTPLEGKVEILGRDVYDLEYVERQRLRARIGFVHGYGGLISNRTVRENIALPASIHGRMTAVEERGLVERTIQTLALEKVADLRPHEMDGATRWRACLGRALVLKPEWLVLEGLGNWEMDRGRGKGWTYLRERQHQGEMATAICLPRHNPGFESWFEEHGGTVISYYRFNPSIPPEHYF